MKHIATIGNVLQKENPDTKVVEHVPVFQVELFNRLKDVNPNVDIDLQFNMGPEDYERMYRKELTFGSMDEMEAARNLLAKIKELDEDDVTYVILNSPFNNTILILTKDLQGETCQFDNIKQYQYMIDILKWINEQEQYF